MSSNTTDIGVKGSTDDERGAPGASGEGARFIVRLPLLAESAPGEA